VEEEMVDRKGGVKEDGKNHVKELRGVLVVENHVKELKGGLVVENHVKQKREEVDNEYVFNIKFK
jgi:hypothetical protein